MLVPTVKGALGGRFVRRKRRLAIEIHSPADNRDDEKEETQKGAVFRQKGTLLDLCDGVAP